MGRRWNCVPIAQIATRVQRPESVDSTKTYRLLGAHWYAKGLYVKDEKPGAEIRASKLFAVRAGDFVYNRLFAWKGSFALAKEEHDGCFVSGEFPCFQLDSERISPRFLWLYFSREAAWLQSLGLSTGSTPTSRNRLKEGQFLKMQVPLPPLDEQRRIVARIEGLAALIEEAQELRAKAGEDAEALPFEAFRELCAQGVAQGWSSRRLREVCDINPSRSQRTNYPDHMLVSFVPMSAVDAVTGCIERSEVKPYSEVKRGYKWFVEGDVIFARITPCMQNGKSAIAREVVNAVAFGSTEFHVLRPRGEVTAEWIHLIVRQPSFRLEAERSFKGSAGQQRVPRGFLEEYKIPVPMLAEQRRVVAQVAALQAQAAELTRLQDATQAELDALLPSVLDRAFKGDL